MLAAYGYDSLGRRTGLTRGNGATTSWSYDSVSRLTQIVHDVGGTGTSHDLTLGTSYNPAGQIVSTTRSNNAYAWGGHYQVDRSYAADGLNRYSDIGGSITPSYDGNGNLTGAGGTATYSYDVENRLALVHRPNASAQGTIYDPMGRLWAAHTTGFRYDGAHMAVEIDPIYGDTLRRHVFGPGMDEPLVSYDVANGSARSWHHADERGSVIALGADNGNVSVNAYDEYGIPASGNMGRFQYTGQAWLPHLGMQYSRARIYSPYLGRFLQTDPIGVAGGMNLYGYVLNEPVNLIDPTGLHFWCAGGHYGEAPDACDPDSEEERAWRDYLYMIWNAVVVTAHSRGGFDVDLFGIRIDFHYNRRNEFLIYVYGDGTIVDGRVVETDDECSGAPVFRPSVSVDPTRLLIFIIHGHQNRAPGEFQQEPYPGPGDGITPALRGITNYQLSSRDIFAIRPSAQGGVGPIEHIRGNSPFPSSAEQVLRQNAANAAATGSARTACRRR